MTTAATRRGPDHGADLARKTRSGFPQTRPKWVFLPTRSTCDIIRIIYIYIFYFFFDYYYTRSDERDASRGSGRPHTL